MRSASRVFVGSAILGAALTLAVHAGAGPLDMPGATKALNCSACHGFAGQSPSDTVPILAGMPAWYLKKAIQDYASGKRTSPEMEPFAKQVLQVGVDDVAAYFAAQKRAVTPIKADPAAVARGKTAYARCALCHGPDARGAPDQGVPDLRGQPPGYLLDQMRLFKADRRSPGDDHLKALKAVMKTIPDEAYADMAAYFSSLRP